ncbi:hypothetical protein R1flu_004472 [Riccia fluitans]|uniref:Transposase n=1 Tax=Riccia fluitans TaxID=41844 RepID=A0ABD1YQZ3_9MARC
MGFPGCIGLIDGTLIKLSQRPRDDGETYYDRKGDCAINAGPRCGGECNIRDFLTTVSTFSETQDILLTSGCRDEWTNDNGPIELDDGEVVPPPRPLAEERELIRRGVKLRAEDIMPSAMDHRSSTTWATQASSIPRAVCFQLHRRSASSSSLSSVSSNVTRQAASPVSETGNSLLWPVMGK